MLNAAKEASEAAKLQLRKDHQAEIEQLKTQFMFRVSLGQFAPTISSQTTLATRV
jgi:hypothetical protein